MIILTPDIIAHRPPHRQKRRLDIRVILLVDCHPQRLYVLTILPPTQHRNKANPQTFTHSWHGSTFHSNAPTKGSNSLLGLMPSTPTGSRSLTLYLFLSLFTSFTGKPCSTRPPPSRSLKATGWTAYSPVLPTRATTAISTLG